MAQITIRSLDDAVLQTLRRRAAASGHSTEEEARRALAMAAGIDRQAARSRLQAVRESLGSHRDEPSEALVREQRDGRTRRLSG